MKVHDSVFTVATETRGFVEVTGEIQRRARSSGVQKGLCNAFVHHTSCSLLFCENADPTVRSDLERFMARLVPDGDVDRVPSGDRIVTEEKPIRYEHSAEGPDDMPAHIRNVLTATDLTVPIRNGELLLGTWQGIYLWEHRAGSHHRRVTLTILGA